MPVDFTMIDTSRTINDNLCFCVKTNHTKSNKLSYHKQLQDQERLKSYHYTL